MMAVWVNSGALLLVMLTGVTYSYPAKQGFHPSSSYSSGYGAYPASAGSTSDVLYAGGYAPAVSGSGAASKAVSYPASYPPIVPYGEPSYPQPSVQRQPAASSYSSNSFAAAPVASGYASSSYAGSTGPSPANYPTAPQESSYPQPSVQRQPGPSPAQPTFSQDVDWAVAPPSPLSGDGASARPSGSQFSGPSNVSPPRPPLPPPPQFQAGELNKYAQISEFGNSESETEEQGFLPPPPGAQALSRQDAQTILTPSNVQPSGLDSSVVQSLYPHPTDYLFLTGQYPPGTVTHSSSSFEQGADNYQDTHYVRYYYPASPSIQQFDTYPAAVKVPQSVQQPSQPVRQSTSYDQSGAVPRYNQPYRAAGGYNQPYGAAGGYNQPYGAAGGYGGYKGDH
ncbi:uncharacterized protein [Pagrus major]|uniref:uncharacterized protein isoform X1 n=1 Tax=Pagrus major TaxID=143350 RepID=UPI003CC8D506